MAKKQTTAYDDEPELTDDEKAALEAEKTDNTLPPADSEEGGEEPSPAPAAEETPAEEALAEEGKPAAEAKPAEAEKPAEQAAPQPTEEDELAAFLEKHKGKSPEELARLAFQQSKRANREGAASRVASQQLQSLAERAKAALERRNKILEAVPDAKKRFRDRLKEDPDGATAELYDRLVEREAAAADGVVEQAQFEQAVGFAQAHVPAFEQRWPYMRALAAEVGYSPEEINSVRDGRDIVVLSLAQVAADLMKGGFIDAYGRPTGLLPKPTEEATDPRLTGPEPIRTVGSGGARANDATPSPEEAMRNLLALSDEDFDKMSEEEINNILRAA